MFYLIFKCCRVLAAVSAGNNLSNLSPKDLINLNSQSSSEDANTFINQHQIPNLHKFMKTCNYRSINPEKNGYNVLNDLHESNQSGAKNSSFSDSISDNNLLDIIETENTDTSANDNSSDDTDPYLLVRQSIFKSLIDENVELKTTIKNMLQLRGTDSLLENACKNMFTEEKKYSDEFYNTVLKEISLKSKDMNLETAKNKTNERQSRHFKKNNSTKCTKKYQHRVGSSKGKSILTDISSSETEISF